MLSCIALIEHPATMQCAASSIKCREDLRGCMFAYERRGWAELRHAG